MRSTVLPGTPAFMIFMVKIMPLSVDVHPCPHIRIGCIGLPKHVRSLHC